MLPIGKSTVTDIEKLIAEQKAKAEQLLINSFCLSAREADVCRELQKGIMSKDIGDNLNISTKTVKFHLTNIFRKMGVQNRTECALFYQNLIKEHEHGY